MSDVPLWGFLRSRTGVIFFLAFTLEVHGPPLLHRFTFVLKYIFDFLLILVPTCEMGGICYDSPKPHSSFEIDGNFSVQSDRHFIQIGLDGLYVNAFIGREFSTVFSIVFRNKEKEVVGRTERERKRNAVKGDGWSRRPFPGARQRRVEL